MNWRLLVAERVALERYDCPSPARPQPAKRSSPLGLALVSLMVAGLLMTARAAAIPPRVPSTAHARQPIAASAPAMLAKDAIPRPPLLRHWASPGGAYHLVLTAAPHWDVKRVTATVFEDAADRCQPVWSRSLPQEYGPRLALVTDTGQTLLLDEWINVASPYAVMVLDATGQVIAQRSFDAIVEVTGLARAEVVEQAQWGFWIAGEPVLLEDDRAAVPAANGQLIINLETGTMAYNPAW